GKQQVGVRVSLRDRPQYVERRPPGRIFPPRSGEFGPSARVTSAPLVAFPALTVTSGFPCRPGATAALLVPSGLGTSSPIGGTATMVRAHRSVSPVSIRVPRAQSVAVIRFFPCA